MKIIFVFLLLIMSVNGYKLPFFSSFLKFSPIKCQSLPNGDVIDDLTQRVMFSNFRAWMIENKFDLFPSLLILWDKVVGLKERIHSVGVNSLLRDLCKTGQINIAELMMQRIGVLNHLNYLNISGYQKYVKEFDVAGSDEWLITMSLGLAMSGKIRQSLSCLLGLAQLKQEIPATVLNQILKYLLANSSTPSVCSWLHNVQALRLRSTKTLHPELQLGQLLCGEYLKKLDFVCGAVSIPTLPFSNLPEVAFIGRSNVGKSSLINLIACQKKLAYTSKTPGKTTEFNYFRASSQRGGFCLVDVPGVGFAKTGDARRRAGWLRMLRTYTLSRRNLQLLMHLVDCRHGLLPADRECLSLISLLPEQVKYVVVLTKIDKKPERGEFFHDVRSITNELRSLFPNITIPVIATSSVSKSGLLQVWVQLLRMLGEDINSLH